MADVAMAPIRKRITMRGRIATFFKQKELRKIAIPPATFQQFTKKCHFSFGLILVLGSLSAATGILNDS